jgi:hypothetical protein
MIDIDFGPEPEPEEEPLPAGEYVAKILGYEIKQSVVSNHEYIQWHLLVDGRREMFHVTSLKREALWKLQELIEEFTGVRPWGKIQFNPAHFIGDTVWATVTVEEYRRHKMPRNLTEADMIRTGRAASFISYRNSVTRLRRG